jgi:hypothetical protein
MKTLLILVASCIGLSTQAQTAIIAHKSHSGSSIDFFIDPSSNFGDPPLDRYPIVKPIIQEIFKPLNDSVMVIETVNLNQQLIKIDTLSNQQRYSPILFETKYKDSIQKKQIQEYNQKLEQAREEERARNQQMESQQQITPEPDSSKKKKKKSYLLFLFGITGGGMLLMKLFGRSRAIQTSNT